MTLDVNNPYLRTKVMTASPEELRLMLIEGAIRFLREGRNAMVQKKYEAQYEALSDAKNIVLEFLKPPSCITVMPILSDNNACYA